MNKCLEVIELFYFTRRNHMSSNHGSKITMIALVAWYNYFDLFNAFVYIDSGLIEIVFKIKIHLRDVF